MNTRMTPAQSISSGLRQYACFSGRATAPEFWWIAADFAVIEVAIVLSRTPDPQTNTYGPNPHEVPK
jgi:uncharacterized membrane protein YhaH (DUF805 family)